MNSPARIQIYTDTTVKVCPSHIIFGSFCPRFYPPGFCPPFMELGECEAKEARNKHLRIFVSCLNNVCFLVLMHYWDLVTGFRGIEGDWPVNRG